MTGSDVDGFMLEPTFGGPEAFAAFIELVQPILRDRGLLAPARAADRPTLRERVTGVPGGRLDAGHPGLRFRPAPSPIR